jgi:hypothetical protein
VPHLASRCHAQVWQAWQHGRAVENRGPTALPHFLRGQWENTVSEVVKFPTPPQGQANDGRERTLVGATRAVAKLSLLGRLEYERARSKVAKELGCRVSFLDRVIASIHEAVWNSKTTTISARLHGGKAKGSSTCAWWKEKPRRPHGVSPAPRTSRLGGQPICCCWPTATSPSRAASPSIRQFRRALARDAGLGAQ